MSQNRSDYRFAQDGNTSNAIAFGNYILKPGAGEIRKPSWNRTETVIRILPQWDFKNNEWSPFRYSPAPLEFGDWIRKYEAVRSFGSKGISMLLFDPKAHDHYDVNDNPCAILYQAVKNAIKNRQEQQGWASLLQGEPGKSAHLRRHGPVYLVRCGIFRINNKDLATSDRAPLGLSMSDRPYFMEIPKTAGEKLTSLLEEPTENYVGDPEDYDLAYKHGDIISLDRGGFVHIFQEGSDPRSNRPSGGGQLRTINVSSSNRGNSSSSSGAGGFQGYDMFISKEWGDYSPNLNNSELMHIIKLKQRPWEECLQFFSHQEQAFLIQDGFPPSAILYAWRDHPEWIKDETKSKAVGRTSVAMDKSVDQDAQVGNLTANPRAKRKLEVATKAGGWGSAPAVDEDAAVDPIVPTIPDSPPMSDDELAAKNDEMIEKTKQRLQKQGII